MSHADGRGDRRNFLLNLAEGSLFIAGASFISPHTVLPALVVRLGGGNPAVGAVAAIAWIGLFLPQVAAARYAQSRPWKKPWALAAGGAQRVGVLLAGITVLLAGDRAFPVGLGAFFAAFALIQILTAAATPGWFDLFAKITPVHLRGRLAGLRNAFGGGGGALCALLLVWILAAFDFPLNYALAFFGAFLLQSASLALQVFLVEREPSPVVALAAPSEFLRQVGRVLGRNIPFRRFLTGCGLLVLASLPAAFITAYALRDLGATEGDVGLFTVILMTVQVLTAPLSGFLADRKGNRIVLACSAAASLAASLTALLAPSVRTLACAFAFVGVTVGSEIMARHNMAVEFAPPAERALYIGLMNTLLAPLYLLGLAGGALVDALGFGALFAAGSACAAGAVFFFLVHVHEPRTLPAGTTS